MKKKRDLPNMQLCGIDLPWVNSGKHLGNNLENKMDGMKHDISVKRAQYITKNNDLAQEFTQFLPQQHLTPASLALLCGTCSAGRLTLGAVIALLDKNLCTKP